jgi:hypothetical protein
MISSTFRRAGLGSALLVVAGLSVGLPSASADGPNDLVPSEAEASAIAEVQAFLDEHPRPEPPAPDAAAEARAAYADAEWAFIRGFPFEAGLAQWGCRSRDGDLLEIEGRPAGWLVIDCAENESPTFAQITAPRTGSKQADARSLVCETLRGGRHCIEFPVEGSWVNWSYQWLGLGTIHGSPGLGISSLPAPQCDVGRTLTLWPVVPVESGEVVRSFWQPEVGSFNFSSVFYQGDEQGNRGGIRSLMCAFDPRAQEGAGR